MEIITPNRIHRLKPNMKSIRTRLNYHLRIQKKWIKRYGYKPWKKTNSVVDWYILNGEYIYHENEMLVAAAWMEIYRKKRILKRTYIGDYWISTIFLSLNHSYSENSYPILFETMSFKNGDMSGINQYRAVSYNEAMNQHDQETKYIGKLS